MHSEFCNLWIQLYIAHRRPISFYAVCKLFEFTAPPHPILCTKFVKYNSFKFLTWNEITKSYTIKWELFPEYWRQNQMKSEATLTEYLYLLLNMFLQTSRTRAESRSSPIQNQTKAWIRTVQIIKSLLISYEWNDQWTQLDNRLKIKALKHSRLPQKLSARIGVHSLSMSLFCLKLIGCCTLELDNRCSRRVHYDNRENISYKSKQ